MQTTIQLIAPQLTDKATFDSINRLMKQYTVVSGEHY